MRWLIYVLAAVAAAPLALLAAEPGADAEVRRLVAKYAEAREGSDPAGIEALFTNDADQLVSTGVWRRGKDTLVAGMLESSRRNSGQRTITVETVRVLAEGVAVADARYVIAGENGAPGREMWSTFVAVKTDAGWRISAIRNMLPRP